MNQDGRTQGLFDSERQLQILIVGDTIPGLTLAILLQKHGFDPLVLTTDTVRKPSELTTLWNAGVRVLLKIGNDQSYQETLVELDYLLVLSNSPDTRLKKISADAEYPHPTVFSTAELSDALHRQFDNDRTRDKGIGSLTARQDSVDVKFDDGVRESFDIVVNAGNTDLFDPSFKTDSVNRKSSLFQSEIAAPIDPERRSTLIEGWIDDVLVQQIPSPDGSDSAVLRMTRRKDTIPVDTVVTRWRQLTDAEPFSLSEKPHRNGVMNLDRTVELGNRGATSRRANGRLVFLSPAAFAFPPASGFHVGCGIEDAWVLADTITNASGSPAKIGNQFEIRRRNRINAIRNRAFSVSSTHPYPVRKTEPFASVTAFRSACLGSFCAAELSELQERPAHNL